MPKGLHISPDLRLPINAVTQKFGILGTSGSGKSFTAMKMAELMLDINAQIIAVDPVGIWWSLRLAKNGKSVGYEQVRVFGGDHGDLPLTKESGALIGRLLAERRISAVLDVSQFTTSEMKKFLTEFAEQFFQSKKRNKSPVHLFLEECQTYIPQDRSDREDPLMLNRWERLIKFFRNYGGGTSMISQQPQSVNKKCLNLADTLFAMRTIGSHERKAIMLWVKDVVESEVDLVASLPKLPTGTAHIWSPSWLGISRDIKIIPKVTFDAGKTPEMGVDAVEPKPLTPVDVEQLKAEMSEMIEKVKQDDPRALRAEIARLQREAKSSPGKPVTVEKIVKVADPDAVNTALTARDEEWLVAFSVFRAELLDKMVFVAPKSKVYKPSKEKVRYESAVPGSKLANLMRPSPIYDKVMKRIPAPSLNGRVKLPIGERAVLVAAVQFNGVEKQQLITLTGYARRSRDAYVQRLLSRGYVVVQGSVVSPTEDGIAALGPDYARLPVGDDLWRYWQSRLPEGESKIMNVLMTAGEDQCVSKDTLMSETGYARRSVDAYLYRLAAKRLVETGGGVAKVSGELFD